MISYCCFIECTWEHNLVLVLCKLSALHVSTISITSYSMNSKLFLLLLSIYCLCHGTIVIKLTNDQVKRNEKTLLIPENGIKISFPLTFCVRFNLKGALLGTIPIFVTEDFKFGFFLRFSVNIGRVFLNNESLMFMIPKHNFQPYGWHHLCVKVEKPQTEFSIWPHSKKNHQP